MINQRTPISEVKRRLVETHGELVTIDESTYQGVSKKALFVDKEYGPWEAIVKDVLAGRLSKKRQGGDSKGKPVNFSPEGRRRLTGRPRKNSLSSILEAASQCKSMTDFKNRFPSQFNAAANHGWKDEVIRLLPVKPRKAYSHEDLKIIAVNYETRRKFSVGHSGAYAAAIKMGVLDDVCRHMQPSYAREGLKGEKAVYILEFPDYSVYVGLSNSPEVRLQEHLSNPGTIKNYMDETNARPTMTILISGLTALNASKVEAQTIERFRSEGRSVLNKAKAGSHGGSRSYTDSEIIQIAKRFSTKGEWAAANGGSYNAAKRRRIFEVCVSHMQILKQSWTLESAMAEGRKYTSRKEWQKKSNRSYVVVAKAGRLDEVMSSQLSSWNEGSVLFEKGKYSTHGEWARKSPGSYNFWKKKLRMTSEL